MSDADREELETLLTERDALRGEVERLRRESVPMCVPTAEGFRRVGGRRLLAAAQSLHRAWKRERAEVGRLRLDVGRLLVAYGSRDEFDGVDDAIKDAAEMRAENNRLRAFVSSLRADGLDIDDPTTAPMWTGKIHAPDGRLVFDLATVGEPRKP